MLCNANVYFNLSIYISQELLTRLMKNLNRISLYFCIVFSYSLQAATVETKVLSQLKATDQAQVIVTLHDPVSVYRGAVSDRQHRELVAQAQASVLSANHLRSANHFKLKRQYSYIPALAGTITAKALAILQNHPQVASIQLDKQRKLSLAESIPHIQADAVHARPYTGKGVTVAILDTGIDTDHPDLADSIVAQHCFSQASCPPSGTNESESAEDDIFGGGHGTHVAGIITSPRGVAPDAGIVAIKVFSNLSVFSVPLDSDILAGLDWIRASTQPVHIISLSFGGGAFSNICDDENPAYANIFKQLRAKGITIFVAAGNEGSKNEISAPACLNDAIAVGATTLSDNIASFSNRNNLVDILAPGVGITSSLIGGGYITQSGTSAATPMAAGVAALMLQANPALTPSLIESVMENSGVIVTDGLTFPRVNALAAVDMAHQSGVAFDFAAKGYKIDETSGAVTIEVSRLGSDTGRVSVEYATVDGTATAGNDYIATSGTLIWENGDMSNKSFVVNILDNSEAEIFEKAFLVSLHTPTRHQATVTILDDDFAGSLEVTGVSGQTFIDDLFIFNIRHGVKENAESITIEVARQEGSKGVVSIDYATVDGSATAGSDYIATQGTLTWGTGDMDNKELIVRILDDSVFEGKETFSVVLSNPTNGATLGENTETIVVIADNEHGVGITDSSFESGETPHPVWSGAMSIRQSPILSNSELAHSGNHFLSLGGIRRPIATVARQSFFIPLNASTLNFRLKMQQAGGGTDNDFMVVFIDGNAHFLVTAAQAADYADYQLILLDVDAYADGNLHNVVFYSKVFGSDTTSTHFLVDDVELRVRDAGTFQFSQTDYRVDENSGLVNFEVARSFGSQGEVSVNYMTFDGSAKANIDYIPANGTLTWADGDTSRKSFTVTITDDAYFENEETFKVSLINPTGGATTHLSFPATITIVNDDAHMVGITDGSFELGTPNPVWNEIDSLGISLICSHATCGPPDFPSQPFMGEYFAWFGSASLPRISALEQTLIIPIGTRNLNFWLQIPSAEGTGSLQVRLDNNPIFGVTEADVADYSDYTPVAVDISAYADGGVHHLGFDSIVLGGGAMRFFVDDVCLANTVPDAPQLEVTIDGYHAQATWTTVAEAQGYIFSYAPYSNPMSEEILNQITALDLGTETTIAGDLASGTALYVAVQAYNCSGISLYSNLGVVIIP
jgi:hypothetical protein